MTRWKLSLLPLLASALIGVAPALLAARFASGPWTVLAAAGAAIAATGFLVGGVRSARELALADDRERRLQSAAATSDARVATLEAKIRDAAAIDDATGVLNRRTFLARLDEAIERDARLKKPMGFLLIDIDGFKQINADAGRLVGDRVLHLVGRAIQAATRGTDFIGRIGGDEFAVVLGECADPRPAVDRVFVALHGETTGGDKPLPIRVSVGLVTIAMPHLGVDPVELFRVAEEALASVQSGGGGLCGRLPYVAESPGYAEVS
jgi:diguanylate cyclase (GGDEF)-like protein